MNLSISAKDKLSSKIAPLVSSRGWFVGFLLLIGFWVRLPHLNQPPIDFHATRQYRSLIIARGQYLESQPSIPEWRKDVARFNAQREGTLEPPIMEHVVAFAYRLAGGEYLWIPKFLSTMLWLTGGLFLFWIAERIHSRDGALFSLAFYLLNPFAITASRSFQPDPLMISLMLASIWAILRYHDQASYSRLILAAVISACAIFVKPVCLFVILGAFTALVIQRHGLHKLATAEMVFFLGISFLPLILFYVFGIFITGFLRTQAESSFLPQLLLNAFFWKNWLTNIGVVIGFPFFIGALAGLLLMRSGTPWALMLGIWIGYAVFNLVFSYHVATHDYYQLQLIPIVALSLGSVANLIWDRLQQPSQPRLWRLAAWMLPLFAVLINAGLALSRPADPTLEKKIQIYEAIGMEVDHSTKTVFLSSDYGLPLQYHGELAGSPWPILSDLEWEELAHIRVLSAEERFDRWYRQDTPEYFIVLDLGEFEGQGDLKDFLFRSFPIIDTNKDYIIFDLRRIGAR